MRHRSTFAGDRRLPALAVAAAAASLLLASCGDDTAEAPAGRAPRPAPVQVGLVGPGELVVEHRLLGEVRALSRAELSVGAAGEVRRVAVREGDRVSRGETLLEIDPRLARAQVRRAQATRQLASEERQLAEWQAAQVAEAGPRAVSGVEIQRSRTAALAAGARGEASAAELAEAQSALSRHRIIAPFDGVVTRRSVDPGDWISPGDPALAIVSDDAVQVIVAAPAELVLDVSPGMPARIRPGSSFEGAIPAADAIVEAEITGVVSALDTDTRTVTLRLTPRESRRWLLAGSTVRVVLSILRSHERAVRIHRDALVRGAVGYRVIEVIDDHAVPRAVEVVATAADAVLVIGEGLTIGDVVVTRGNERLRPDQDVRIQRADNDDEGRAEGAEATGSEEG